MSSFLNPAVSADRLHDLLDQYPIDQIPLDRAALALARPHCERMAWEATLSRLDELAEEVRQLAGAGTTGAQWLEPLRQVLFQRRGFRGNEEDYYSPENSFLNRVLETRRGNPILLSLLMIEVGGRIGLDLVGIGLPCHFLVGYPDAGGMRYFDPFFGGVERTEAGCVGHINKLSGGSVRVLPEHFEPVSKRAFLSRILVNLRCIYRSRGETHHLISVLKHLLLLHPGDSSLHIEAAQVLSEMEDPREALRHVEAIVGGNPEMKNCARVRTALKEVAGKLAALN